VRTTSTRPSSFQLEIRRRLTAHLGRLPLGWFGERHSREVDGGRIAVMLHPARARYGWQAWPSSRRTSASTLTLTRAARYSLAAGATRTVQVRVTDAARKLLQRRDLAVWVTVEPTEGKSVARRLTLKRR
jgi:hypothetical protein